MPTATSIDFPIHTESNGVLSVFECGRKVPFDIRRVFTVSARKGDVRGDHAHKQCTQLLVCTSGKIHVACDDGAVKSEHLLQHMGNGLLIPPGIWSTQNYLVDDAVLMVLCDRGYEAADYIRDHNDFKVFLAQGK